MEVLVMGGTRFLGRRLVAHLLDNGCRVTVATRGNAVDEFGDRVTRVIFERTSIESMKQAFGQSRFDIVYDQIGYSPDDAADAIEVFAGHIGRYIFTSSRAVYYHCSGRLTEQDFDPMSIEPGKGRYEDLGYADGKRGAEALLMRQAPFPVAIARLPATVGAHEGSRRFHFHIERVLRKQPIVVPNPDTRMAYLWSDDAGRFLTWLGLTGRTGPYNAASRDTITTPEIIDRMAAELGVDYAPHTITEGPEDDLTPYRRATDYYLDPSRAESDGFVFTPLDEWFPKAIREVADEVRTQS